MSHPTRQLLLDAGLQLIEAHGLARMTVDAVVNKTGHGKGTFYVHFSDRSAFLVALHTQFHERLLNAILSSTAGLSPGVKRLQRGTITYLNGCLQEHAVKALLLEARSDHALAAEVQHRNAQFAALAQADFAALEWPHTDSAARLFVAMVAEAALVELEIGQANDAVRLSLWHFVGIKDEFDATTLIQESQ